MNPCIALGCTIRSSPHPVFLSLPRHQPSRATFNRQPQNVCSEVEIEPDFVSYQDAVASKPVGIATVFGEGVSLDLEAAKANFLVKREVANIGCTDCHRYDRDAICLEGCEDLFDQ